MLTLCNISHAYDEQQVLKDINLEIQQGEIICLLGPSGCGKTTLLRIIAGLETPNSGSLQLNNNSLAGIPPHQRGFGLMFQEYALFPHMDVEKNIAFGLRMQNLSKDHIYQQTQSALSLVGMTDFESRDVNSLSGGERQRVALARSLAPNPHLLMLDEPLGSLDAALREQLVVELREIIKQTGITSIYVTHDQHEAFAISDRIVIMRNGNIEQIGGAQELYAQPQTKFVAQFLGLHNVISITAEDFSNNHPIWSNSQIPEDATTLLLHPDYLSLEQPLDDHIRIDGLVKRRVFLGRNYRFTVAPTRLNSNLTFYVAAIQHIPLPEEQITIYYPRNKILFLSR
ncbi:ABC transporter ATP-binding protein [Chloroflexota bacterium]